MKLTYDSATNRFSIDANDFDTSTGVLEDFRQYIEAFQSHPDADILIYRDNPSTPSMDWQQVSQISSFEKDELIELFRGRRIAGVLPAGDRFGVARQVSSLAELIGVRYQPFRSEQEALTWLSVPPD